MKTSSKFLLAIAGLTAFAFLLRIYHIDAQCMTWDENFTKNLAITNASHIISFSFTVDPNPPLYYLVAHVFGNLYGFTPFIMRLPAAIFGTLAVPVVYLIGKEYRDEILGLLMAATVTISYQMIFYGQFARAYSTVFFFFAIATYAFLKMFRDEKVSWCLLFTVAASLAMWSHAYAAAPLGLMWLYILWKKGKSILVEFVLFLLWCSPFLYYVNVLSQRSNEHFGGAWWQVAYMLPLELFWIPSIFVIPLFIRQLCRNRESAFNKPEIFLGFVAAVTMASAIIISFVNPIFPRYALLIAPIVLAIGLSPIIAYIENLKTVEQKYAAGAVFIFIIFACSYTPLLAWYFITNCPYV